jgi:hypothetical protein
VTRSQARASWSRGRYCLAIVQLIFFTADTLTVRLLLAWGSGLYAVLLVWPEIANALRVPAVAILPGLVEWLEWHRLPSVFARPAYAIMVLFPGGVWLWFGLYMGHMIGVHWRVFDPVERERWALSINILGFVVWAYSTASLVISLKALLPTSALELVVIFFSFWVMVRTGLQRELLTP